MENFFALNRDIMKHWVYTDIYAFRVWMHILLRTQYVKSQTQTFYNGTWITQEYGEFVYGRESWSKQLQVPEQRLRTIMRKFEKEGMICNTNKVYPKCSLLSVVNYAKFNQQSNQQSNQQESLHPSMFDDYSNQQSNHTSTGDQPASNRRSTTIKKDNKEKKEKKEKNTNTYPQYCLDIIERWNGTVVIQPKVLGMNKSRLLAIDAIYKDSQSTSLFEDVFAKVAKSEFLGGKNDNGWICTFDWVLKQENWQKIVEGNYENRIAKNQSISASEKIRQILNQKESEAL